MPIHTPVPDTYPELEQEEIIEMACHRNTMRFSPQLTRWVAARPTIPAPAPETLGDTTEADEAWSSDALDIEIDLDDPDLDIEVLFDSIRIAEEMVAEAVTEYESDCADARLERSFYASEAEDELAAEEPPQSTQRSRIAQVADRCNEERAADWLSAEPAITRADMRQALVARDDGGES